MPGGPKFPRLRARAGGGGAATASPAAVTATAEYPELHIEWMPDASPNVVDGTWVTMTPFLAGGSCKRGRRFELDRFVAGTLNLTLRTTTRLFDPEYTAGTYYGKLTPMRQIRVRATWAGMTYAVWRGYVISWGTTNEVDVGADTVFETTITARDGFERLERIRLPSSAWALEVQKDNPSLWFRLGESDTLRMSDSSTGGNYGLYGGSFPSAGLTVNDADGAIGLDHSPDTRNIIQNLDVISGYPFTVMAMFQLDGTDPAAFHVLWQGLHSAATSPLTRVEINIPNVGSSDGVGGALAAYIRNSSLRRVETSIQVTDGLPHHMAVVFASASSFAIWIDGVDVTTVTDVGSPAWAGNLVEHTLGNYAHSLVSQGSFGFGNGIGPSLTTTDATRGIIDEFTIFNGKALSAARIAALALAAKSGWDGDDTGARCTRFLDAIGWPSDLRDIDSGISILGAASWSAGASALSVMQAWADTELGAFFAGKDGKVVWRSRHYPFLDLAAVRSRATFTDGHVAPVAPDGLVLDGTSGTDASTPDNAAWTITGGIRIAARIKATDYTGAAGQQILNQWTATGNQRAWMLRLAQTTGTLAFIISSDGTAVAVNQESSAPGFVDGTTYWVGVEYNTATGALTFYKAADQATLPTIWSGWTLISTHAVAAAVPFNSTAALRIGAQDAGTSGRLTGNVYRAVLYDDGVAVADADFTSTGNPLAIPGATTYTDSLGNVWTVNGTAVISDVAPVAPDGLVLDGTSGGYASAPDSAGLSVTGDIDVRMRVSSDAWPSAGKLCGKAGATDGTHAWDLRWTAGGVLNFRSSPTGSWGALTNAASTVGFGGTNGVTYWIRVTRVSSTGTVKFYKNADSATMPTSWTQLGADVASVAGGIYDESAAVVIGANSSGTETMAGRFYRSVIYNGIDGTIVGDADFTSTGNPLAIPGATTYTDSLGNVWTVNGTAVISAVATAETVGAFKYDAPGFSLARDENMIRNPVTASRTGGISVTVRDDNLADNTYGDRHYPSPSTEDQKDSAVRDRALWILGRYKEEHARLASMRVSPLRDPANLWPQVLDLELGDRITVERTPGGSGNVISADQIIESISHRFSPLEWTTTFEGSPVDANVGDYLILDDAVSGLLDAGLLAY